MPTNYFECLWLMNLGNIESHCTLTEVVFWCQKVKDLPVHKH